MNTKFTYEYLNDAFAYDPETGVLKWKERPRSHFSSDKVFKWFNSRFVGKSVGANKSNGYQTVIVDKTEVYCHRIAFMLIHKRLPEKSVDHINGNRTDNRACNLRAAEHVQNCANSVHPVSDPEFRGVTKNGERWIAQISFMNKNVYLGTYDTQAEAYAAFCGAAILARGEFAKLNHQR